MKFTTTLQKAIPTTLALGLVLSLPIAAQNLDEPQPVADAEQTAPMTDEGSLEYQEPQEITLEDPVLQAEEVTIETQTEPTLDPAVRAEVDGEIVEPADRWNQDEPLTDRNEQMADLEGDDEELPRTASPLPLLLLIGSAGAGTAFGLRRRRNSVDS